MGYFMGSLGYLLGLILSAILDLPSGAVIVWCLAFVAMMNKIIFLDLNGQK